MDLDNKHQTSSHAPSFWQRINASILDYLVILLWMAIIASVSFAVSLALGGYPNYLDLFGPVGTQVIFFIVLTFPVGLYLFITESSARHATFGKRKVGIKVAQTAGGVPSKSSIVVRTIVKLLPWEIAHTFVWQMQYVFYQNGYNAEVPIWIFIGLSVSTILVIMYVSMIAIRRDGKAPHDLVAGTQVIYK